MQAKQRMKEAQHRQKQQLQEARNRQRMLHAQARERDQNARNRRDAYATAFHGLNQTNFQTHQGGTFMQVQHDPATGSQWMQIQVGEPHGEEFTDTDGGQWEEMPAGGEWESFPDMTGQPVGDEQWEQFPDVAQWQEDDAGGVQDEDLQRILHEENMETQSTVHPGEHQETEADGNLGDVSQQQGEQGQTDPAPVGSDEANTASLSNSRQDENQMEPNKDQAPPVGNQPAASSSAKDETITIKKEPETENDADKDETTGLAANTDNPSTSNAKPDLSTFLADAEGDLTCPICFELMRDPHTPKNLNCGHVCCLVCLQTMTQNSRNVQCPTCRFITCTAGIQLQNMKTNWHVKNLAETYHKHSQETHGSQQNYGPCKVHGDLIRYYCDSCNKIGCGSCIYENHDKSRHNIKNLREVCEQNKIEINNLLERSITKSEETKKKLAKISKDKQACEENVLLEEERIDAEMHEKIAKVYQEAEDRKTKLRRMSQAKIGTMEREKQQMEAKHGEMQKAIATALEAIESCTEYDYVTKHKKLALAMKNCL